MPDPWETLGLKRGASPAEIKQAFGILCRRIPPERRAADPQAAKEFQQIFDAYHALWDPDVRNDPGPREADGASWTPEPEAEEPPLKPGEEFNLRRLMGKIRFAAGAGAACLGGLIAASESESFLCGVLGFAPVLDEDRRMAWFLVMIAGIATMIFNAEFFMISDKEYRDEWDRGVRKWRLSYERRKPPF